MIIILKVSGTSIAFEIKSFMTHDQQCNIVARIKSPFGKVVNVFGYCDVTVV